jgi:hypothetical protein
MWLFNRSSSAARVALIYITVGAMIVIWTGVWCVFLHNNPPDTTSVYYLVGGLLVTGLTFLGIGFGLGSIGRAARHADMPAEVAAPALVVPAANPPGPVAPVVPSAPIASVATPDRQVVAATSQGSWPTRK